MITKDSGKVYESHRRYGGMVIGAQARSTTEQPVCSPLFRDLIIDGRVALLGVVRQEVLSGIRHADQFERLKNYLRAFPDLELVIDDYELAAEFYNTCRRQGIQGANTDFLVVLTLVMLFLDWWHHGVMLCPVIPAPAGIPAR